MKTPADWLTELRSEVPRIREGAFAALYVQAFPQVRGLLRPLGAGYDDAAELLQSAMVLLVEKVRAPDFLLRAQPVTYLVAIAKYAWQNQRRRAQREVQSMGAPMPELLEIPEAVEEDALLHDFRLWIDMQGGGMGRYAASPLPPGEVAVEEALFALIADMDRTRRPNAHACLELLTDFYVHRHDMATLAARHGFRNGDAAKVQKHRCLERLKTFVMRIPLFRAYFGTLGP